jgi:hypothetical protein
MRTINLAARIEARRARNRAIDDALAAADQATGGSNLDRLDQWTPEKLDKLLEMVRDEAADEWLRQEETVDKSV